MDTQQWLAEHFEAERPRLRAIAYQMLGSLLEADDAVQETWLRLGRVDHSSIGHPGHWLATVVARVCLDMLRVRKTRREEAMGVHLPAPVVSLADEHNPEYEAELADSVGLALLVILERLSPAERIAFVLHDIFAIPFDTIAGVVGRSEAAARQLASRARRRVQGAAVVSDCDLTGQRAAIDAFFAAARDGDFDALLTVLDPEVVLRADFGASGASREICGAPAVARQALIFAQLARSVRPALVNGVMGVVVMENGRPFAVMGFTLAHGKIGEITVFADAVRLRRLDLPGN